MVDSDEGSFRICKTDASETVKQVLFEAATELLDISTDPRQQIIVPMSQASLREDDKLIIEMKVATATSAAVATSTVRVPIRKRNVRTGNVAESYLRITDFTSANVTVGAGVWVRLGAYTVSAQEEVRLGQSIAENSRIYCAFVEV
jgi:hypothetical protein